jgi:broad specificity phosphatase PhoE
LRVYKFLDWLQASQYWNKNILLVGHGGSIKFCLEYFGVNNPEDPKMGELHSIEM